MPDKCQCKVGHEKMWSDYSLDSRVNTLVTVSISGYRYRHARLLDMTRKLGLKHSGTARCGDQHHASRLVAALDDHELTESIALEKDLGETQIRGLRELDNPPWRWPTR